MVPFDFESSQLNFEFHWGRTRRPDISSAGEFDMATRNGSAVWEGTLKEGKGTVKLGSGAFEGPYSFASRFEEGTGTNPEELIGAAHAGCFSMALSAGLSKAGISPKRIATTAKVHLGQVEGGFAITLIELDTTAEVPGHRREDFSRTRRRSKEGLPGFESARGNRDQAAREAGELRSFLGKSPKDETAFLPTKNQEGYTVVT